MSPRRYVYGHPSGCDLLDRKPTAQRSIEKAVSWGSGSGVEREGADSVEGQSARLGHRRVRQVESLGVTADC